MSEENVDVVTAMFEPLARGDFSAWADFSDDFDWWVVMTLRGGELARAEVFPERAEALEAAGLSE
jgi:ketosteroid isomerase-like protein